MENLKLIKTYNQEGGVEELKKLSKDMMAKLL